MYEHFHGMERGIIGWRGGAKGFLVDDEPCAILLSRHVQMDDIDAQKSTWMAACRAESTALRRNPGVRPRHTAEGRISTHPISHPRGGIGPGKGTN